MNTIIVGEKQNDQCKLSFSYSSKGCCFYAQVSLMSTFVEWKHDRNKAENDYKTRAGLKSKWYPIEFG